ncbi:MAG: hypothetical protein ABS87_00980 [Sphingomonas sp. SCN 67-18]|nr:MAG: hypothetical protein ABS87_00980 [Sphingomonas sp. SCN 67-18]
MQQANIGSLRFEPLSVLLKLSLMRSMHLGNRLPRLILRRLANRDDFLRLLPHESVPLAFTPRNNLLLVTRESSEFILVLFRPAIRGLDSRLLFFYRLKCLSGFSFLSFLGGQLIVGILCR